MTQTYLVVFEKGNECWGAFAPDVHGTGGMGDTIDQARNSLREGIGYILEHALKTGLPIPKPASTSVDFKEFDPDPSTSHYEIEWLTVELPATPTNVDAPAHQAA